MPIRFRCAYCNQLLGISRRKAGTVVRCPTCAGQVVVPNVETEKALGPASQADEFIFERSDFDNLLNPAGGAPQKLEEKGSLFTSSDDPLAMPPAAPASVGELHTQSENAPD